MNTDIVKTDKGDIVFSEEIQKAFGTIALYGEVSNQRTFVETPEEFIESRIIAGSEERGDAVYADYIRQFYILRELNRLYPGWYVKEDWACSYIEPTRCVVFLGNLMVREYDWLEKKFVWRSIPGIGSLEIQFKKEASDNRDFLTFTKPDDMFKGARTEFIKNAAYWLGIGFDVYSQEIPTSMRSAFEDLIRDWDITDHVLAVAESLKRKKNFKAFYQSLPNVEQTAVFKELLTRINVEHHNKLWQDFQRQNSATVDKWLKGLAGSKLTNKE